MSLTRRGVLRVDLSFRHTQQDQLRSGGSATDSVLRPKVDFDVLNRPSHQAPNATFGP